MAKKASSPTPGNAWPDDGSNQRAESSRMVAAQRRGAAAAKPTAAFVVPGQKATGLAPNPSVSYPGRGSNVPFVDMNTLGGKFTMRANQGPIHPDSFEVVAGWAAGIPMAAAGAIPYGPIAEKTIQATQKVTRPVSNMTQHYVNRGLNAIRGERVIIHSSPVTGLTRIEPRAGSAILPNQRLVFGWDSRAMSPRDWLLRQDEFTVDPAVEAGIHAFPKEATARYTGWKPSYENDEILSSMTPGSSYVATVPKDATRVSPNVSPWQGNRRYDYEPGVQPGAIVSSAPARVKAEVPVPRENFDLTAFTHLGERSPVQLTGDQYRSMLPTYAKFREQLANEVYKAGGNYNYTNPYGMAVRPSTLWGRNPAATPPREEFVPLPFGHRAYLAVSEKGGQAKNAAKEVAAKIKAATKPKPKMKPRPPLRPPSVFD